MKSIISKGLMLFAVVSGIDGLVGCDNGKNIQADPSKYTVTRKDGTQYEIAATKEALDTVNVTDSVTDSRGVSVKGAQ